MCSQIAFAGSAAGGLVRIRIPSAARAEPETLRYKILHAAARLTHSGRRHRLKISRTWPWARAITTAWTRLNALPQAL